MKKIFSKICLLAFFTVCLVSTPALAAESEWQSTKNDEGSIRLISAGYDEKGELISGIEFKFKDNWHTYWKFPGDSGMAITPDLSTSENIKSSKILWPIPKRELFYDLESWQYGDVILPVVSKIEDSSKPVKLVAHVKWAVCDENCIFADNTLSLEIGPGYKNEQNFKTINEFINKVPQKLLDNSNVKLEKFLVSKSSVLVQFSSDKKFSDDIDLFINDDSKNFRYPKPGITISEDGKLLTIQTNYEKLKQDDNLIGKNLYLTLRNGETGFETSKNVDEISTQEKIDELTKVKIINSIADDNSDKSNIHISLLQAIIAALLGGMILNFMPCVLPVLMLKIFGVIKHGDSDKKYIRKSFSYTIAGIIFSFILIAVFVIILKSLGHTVGWGIQFQQPAFLVFLSVLLTLFAANQWGWFEINLPQKISDRININLDKAGDSTPLGHFLTGAFATLLATPCTAPFLVTAVSFAFTAETLQLILIFVSMGMGLSIPYLLILISPSLVKIFPKPGRWMKIIRIILGIFLFLTNIWIFLIFFQNGGPNSGFMLLVCVSLLTIWLGVSHRLKLNKTKTALTTIYMILVTFFISLYLADMENEPSYMKDSWVQFDEAKIGQFVSEGKVVFVDVTAKWCLTCQFNKANVIYPMKDYFDKEGVILMKADYTNPNKPISDYLEKNKSFGIPFNKVYGPHAKQGIILPVILKKEYIIQAIEKAKKK